jgi:two-component system, chemotaxis family, response regulator WspF
MTLIAIGASAGGPAALAAVLKELPPDLPAAVVLVQHLDEHMATGMAEWLRLHSRMPVRIAVEGERVTPGVALLAGTNDHLVLKTPDRVGYTRQPAEYVYRPSVDAFFDSIGRHWRGEAFGVLLTGMGRDGAAGLKRLREQGRHTIAQDQQSSAVYGMPKAAAAMAAAVDILPLDRIAARLVHLVHGGRVASSGVR